MFELFILRALYVFRSKATTYGSMLIEKSVVRYFRYTWSISDKC
jgi:hypothetical protein